ncbi:UDP-N-acetylmuramate dehydrogenase [Pollutibacter soli]|uniref:UDP-N-acetylmuramate dehydrogenase n=1 Tax=Pollutibacter soli TaxID=3034157 RepID=UPI00301359C1
MQIQENISLKNYNSFGLDVNAKYFSVFTDIPSLAELLETGRHPFTTERSRRLLILGGGSNMLLTNDFNGLVIKNNIPGIRKTAEDEQHVYVTVGAGENWHETVMHCIDMGWGGLENLALIPGNTGASPMQNIGAYGVEIKDHFYQLEAWDIEDKKTVIFTAAECEFGYRESVFKGRLKNRFVITSVSFRLDKNPAFHITYGAIREELERQGVQDLSIRAIADAVISIRRSKLPDPAVIGNAGSFFKNPEIPASQFEELKSVYPEIVGYPLPGAMVKLAAGWLIEKAGWKGYREGDAGCHAKQALVLVNYGNASGHEILKLSDKISESVREKFGVHLQKEVNVV